MQDPTHKREFCKLRFAPMLEDISNLKKFLKREGFLVLSQHSANVLNPLDQLIARTGNASVIMRIDEMLAKVLDNWGNYTILSCRKL